MGSLCYSIIMSIISYIIHIVTFIIVFVINIRSVNGKVHVVTSQDKLAVKVGHDIFAKMGKHGIELEKIEDNSDETLTEMLRDTPEDDEPVNKHEHEDTKAVGISGFLARSLTGEAFYSTLFWIVFGVLIGQLARDVPAYLKTSSSTSNHSLSSSTDNLALPPPYKMIEEKVETV